MPRPFNVHHLKIDLLMETTGLEDEEYARVLLVRNDWQVDQSVQRYYEVMDSNAADVSMGGANAMGASVGVPVIGQADGKQVNTILDVFIELFARVCLVPLSRCVTSCVPCVN